MDKNVYLKFPNLEDKEKWFEYIKEYINDNPKTKPLSCGLDINYEEWLIKINKEHKGVDLDKGRVPSSIYFLMRDDTIIGNLSIRHNINNDFLASFGGHIGYGIRPCERRKGYATILLRFALEKCQELGLKDVLVTCKENNIGSYKTIEKNHGKFKRMIYNPEEDLNYKMYWINVEESLKK